jgi:hypothetical protein
VIQTRDESRDREIIDEMAQFYGEEVEKWNSSLKGEMTVKWWPM